MPMPDARTLVAHVRAARPAAVAAALLAAAVLVGGGYWLVERRGWVTTDDAFVEGAMSYLAAEVPGRVLLVAVDQHQAVHAGDLLLRLDPADYEARAAKARADVAAARNGMRAAEASAGSAQAERKAAEAELWRAEQELGRITTLFENDAASRRQLEQARSARDAAAERTRALGLRADAEAAVLGDEAPVRQAEASLREAELALAHTELRAPYDAIVGRKNVEPGTIVAPGQPLLALTGAGQSWVIANFKETQIGELAVGSAAEVTIDAFPGRVWRGHVESFSPATGAKYALIPAEPAAGNFTRVVQRVPVKIVLDGVAAEGSAAHAEAPVAGGALPVGLSARVRVAGR
jgi:membrane fusion protein (multidrug efflux system)